LLVPATLAMGLMAPTPPARAEAPGEGAPPAGPAGAGAPMPGAPVRIPERLTLRDAFLISLKANKDVRVAWFAADQDEARIMGAEGEFDATLFAQVTRGRTNTPVAGVPLGRTDTADTSMTAGVRKRFVSGTNLELTASNDYSRDVTGASALNPAYSPELALALRQDLLRNFGIDVNRTSIVVAQNNWEIAREALRDTIIQDLFLMERAYWDLYFALADLEVREQQLDRAQKLVERAEAQVGVGESAPIEVTRARASAAAQETAILNARNTITRLRHNLLRQMGVLDMRAVRADFELADDPPEELFRTDLDRAWEAARRHRPEYAQAELRVRNAELDKRFAENQRLPTLQLFGEYSMAGLGDDLSAGVDEIEDGRFNSWEVGLAFEWPFPNRTARSAYRVAALERRIQATRLEDVLERIAREVADALDDLSTAEGRILTASEARRLAAELLRAEEKSFSLGRSDSLDVLNAQESVAAAERDEVRARTDYATAVANLLRAQGNFLTERNVAFLEHRPR
jgi:outer membrane protein TolC